MISWYGEYYPWKEIDGIELTIKIDGVDTVIKSSYDSVQDVSAWTTLRGLKGKMMRLKYYGKLRSVYIISVDTNTENIKITSKAIK